MKYCAYFIILLSCLSMFTSCKKSYTCSCSTNWTYKTSSGAYNTETFAGDKSAYSSKLTKNQAKNACNHERVATETNFTNGITGNGSYPLLAGESIYTSCSIILD